MLVVYIVGGVVLFALAVVGTVYGISYLIKGKDEADLDRYLGDEECRWERMPTQGGGEANVLFRNTEPESAGIEMRVYYVSELPEGQEDEGVCLSIIDPARSDGVILNGFGRSLDAMQFGDGIWHDQFLGDAGIMEKMITEKRVAWDQVQREIIVAHYSLFM